MSIIIIAIAELIILYKRLTFFAQGGILKSRKVDLSQQNKEEKNGKKKRQKR